MAQPEETEALPGFTQPTPREAALLPPGQPRTTPGAAPSTPTSPAPPTTPTQSLPPEVGPTEAETNPPFSPISSEVTPDVSDALDNLAGDAFEVVGYIINRAARARTKTHTTLWLVSEEESTAFAEAAGRIAARRIPEELREEGDASDLLVMGSVALGYVAHNALGIGAEELAQAASAPAPAQPAAAPVGAAAAAAAPAAPAAQPPPPPPAPTPAAAVVRTAAASPDEPQGSYGAVAATPPPPDVISPGI